MNIAAELAGSVVSVDVSVGASVRIGDTVVVLESMKMEIPVVSDIAGTISRIAVTPGTTVAEGDVLVVVEP